MLVIAVVILTAVFASSALAAGNSSATSAYGNTGTKVQAVIGKAKKPVHATLAAKTTVKVKKVQQVKSQTLPFTGLDLGFVAGAGVLLVGMGLSLRRISRKPTA